MTDAALLRAYQHAQAGEMAQAETLCLSIVRTSPRNADAWSLLGTLAYQSGRAAAALDYFQHAAVAAPATLAHHSNCAVALLALGRFEEAETLFRDVVRRDPSRAEAHFNLGNALRERQRFDEAEACYLRAAELRPDYVEAHNNLGNIRAHRGAYTEAVASYKRVLELQPLNPEGHNNLGAAYWHLRQLPEAIARFRRALEQRPDYAEAHQNLGSALGDVGQVQEGIASNRRAIACQPNYADAHHSLALMLLSLGDFEHGLAEFEWRYRVPGRELPSDPRPLWDGSPLAGRTILVCAEQGFGDTIQFVRYLPLIQGGVVLFHSPRQLAGLMRSCRGIDRLIPEDAPLPPFDVHVPLLSLPRLIGTTLKSIPATVPYLAADPVHVERLRERVAGPDFKIGIVWQGSTKFLKDSDRSVPFQLFEPLMHLAGVRLHSLQVGAAPGDGVIDLGSQFDRSSFEDAAAAVRNMDLIVTVDTALAHLAGALGAPVWVLLPFAADWRWLRERDDSPWYPTMRLFRQTRPGAWNDVFGRVKDALESVVTGRGPSTQEM